MSLKCLCMWEPRQRNLLGLINLFIIFSWSPVATLGFQPLSSFEGGDPTSVSPFFTPMTSGLDPSGLPPTLDSPEGTVLDFCVLVSPLCW